MYTRTRTALLLLALVLALAQPHRATACTPAPRAHCAGNTEKYMHLRPAPGGATVGNPTACTVYYAVLTNPRGAGYGPTACVHVGTVPAHRTRYVPMAVPMANPWQAWGYSNPLTAPGARC